MEKITPDLESALTEWQIRYSLVWEDFRCIEKAFRFQAEQRFLLIGSAGCNAFNCLIRGVCVDAVDLNPAQLALMELKKAAIAYLDYSQFVRLMGLMGESATVEYQQIRNVLKPQTRLFFDSRPQIFDAGLINSGRLEKFFSQFRQEHLFRICPELQQKNWLKTLGLSEQRRWLGRIDWIRLREAILAYFDLEGLTRGRSAAQMKFVTRPGVSEAFFEKFRGRLESGRIAENFYLYFFLTGEFCDPAFWPDYLQRRNFAVLRRNLPSLRLIHSSIEAFLADSPSYEGMILSDIFEYMSADHTGNVLGALYRRLHPTGRLAFWNLLVDRKASAPFRHLERGSRDGHAADRMWFYDCFQVYERSAN